MSYLLSVDLGTTFSAAALRDGDGVEIFSLGSQTATIPSVVALRADGTVLTGEAADRRGVTEPARVAREFKRRLGDPTPIVIGGTPYGAETLMADLLRAIVDQVAQQQAGAPTTVVLSHPANYGPYKLDLLGQVGHLAELDHVEFITEPQAAAVHYLELHRIESGEVVVVYDLGGGTFDAALVRRNDTDFELLGTPDGLERFGGVDLDEAVFDHVRRSLGRAMEGLDPNDPTVTSALVRLREDCRAAKEALSSDTDTAIPVMLPALHTEVRLTRGEFEDMIRPRLRETMTMLQRVVASAGLGFDDMSQVLLVGGSSRIPLVGEMVQEATGLPIGLAAHPKHAIALGAASAGEATTKQAPIAAVLVVAEHEPPPPSEEPESSEPPDEPEPPLPSEEPEPPRPPEQPETAAAEEAPSIRSSRRILIPVVALLVVAAGVIGGVLLASDDAGTETVAELVVPVRIAITSGDAEIQLVTGAWWDPFGPIEVSGPDVDAVASPDFILISRLSDPEAGTAVEAAFEVMFFDVEETVLFDVERSDPSARVMFFFAGIPDDQALVVEGDENPFQFEVSRQDLGG